MDFKNTIFLPSTNFQMRGNLTKKEPEILAEWERENIYAEMREKLKHREKFIIHDGPPFANGDPHAGHAMNKVIKDVINRMKQMQGYDAAFTPGWDCHGLPIEWKIEQKYKEKHISKSDVSVAKFRDECQEFAQHWINVQREGFKRIGGYADWDHPYLTMSKIAEATVIRQFGKYVVDGSLYRGEKPVFWSVVEKTALADAEIEYYDKKSTSIYVAFSIVKTEVDFLKGAYCIIWTTTPWTIPGNRAICYSKEITYCLLNVGGKKFVVAKELVENFLKTCGLSGEIEREFGGEILQGTECCHPFVKSGYDFTVPLIHGEHVTTEAGTGLVHTAPGHGIDDFNVCRTYGIKVPATVDESGVYCDCVPMFAGKHIFKIDDEMVQVLIDADALVGKTEITHSYPHSWRSKAPLIYRTTPQWFISMDKTGLRQKALREIDKTNWIPKQGYNRIRAFVEKRSDWCVSRQRVWGVPLPLFMSKKDGEPIRDPELIERIAKIFEEKGANAWFEMSPQEILGNKYNADDYVQIKDTVDVWFESASTYAYTVRASGEKVQADLYIEGSDQHRGWFQHSLLNCCEMYGDAPFKTVMTHGFIVDEEGRKMSKSIGNTVTLQDIVNNLGADIFRMWVAYSDFTEDLRLGRNILKQLEDVYKKLRNTIRYMLGALSEYDKSTEKVEYSVMPDLEKWILHRLVILNDSLQDSISKYDINRYFTALHTFCSNELSSFYFDIRKDCLYCDDKNSTKRKAYRYVVYQLFQHIIRWLAPVIVFTSEEAWKSLGNNSSIHLEEFWTPKEEWRNSTLAEKIDHAKEIRKLITAKLELLRKDKIIGSSLQAAVTVYDPANILGMSADFWNEIAITSKFDILHEEVPADVENVENIGIKISLAKGEKCERCWKICENLDENKLCERCQQVVKHC